MRRFALLALTGLLILLFVPRQIAGASAPASNYYRIAGAGSTVDAINDNQSGSGCTLREAIARANSGSTTTGLDAATGCTLTAVGSPSAQNPVYRINLPANFTYTLTQGELAIEGRTLHIVGNADNLSTIQGATTPGGATHRVLRIESQLANVGLYNLTLRNGACLNSCLVATENGGILLLDAGSLTGDSLTFTGGLAGGQGGRGGAIYMQGGADLSLVDSSFSDNEAVSGGCITASGLGTSILTTSTTFDDCTGLERGGAIYNTGASVLILNAGTVFGGTSGNAADQGGAIYNEGLGSTVNLSGTVVVNNSASEGGAIYNIGGGSVTVTGASAIGQTGAGNTAGSGGAVFNTGLLTTFTLTGNSTMDANGASEGGAVYNTGSALFSIDTAEIGASASNIATGAGGGGVYNSGILTRLTLTNGSIRNSRADAGDGGGIFNTGGAGIEIEANGYVRDSVALGDGGGIYSSGIGSLLLMDTGRIQDNVAGGSGGGLYNTGGAEARLIDRSWITNNGATENGGGVFNNSSAGIFDADYSFITSNTAAGMGGSIYNVGGAYFIMTSNSSLSGSAEEGGGIYNTGFNSRVVLDDVILYGSTAVRGAGAYNAGGGVLNLRGGTVVGSAGPNSATEAGGAIYMADADTITAIEDSDISNNSAPDGGGIYVNTGTLRVVRSILWINKATGRDPAGRGGAIYAVQGQTTVFNTSFWGNSARTGSAIYAGADNDPQLNTVRALHVSVLNQDGPVIGLATNANTSFSLGASLLDVNTGVNCDGTIVSEGYNISDDASCNLNAAGDQISTDPQMDIRQNIGGFVSGMPLQDGSPAIDSIPAAACILFEDQRSFGRPKFTGCDAGAVEMGELSPLRTVDEEDLYNALEAAIADQMPPTIAFILADIQPAGIALTIQTPDGTVLTSFLNLKPGSPLLMQIDNVLQGGSPASSATATAIRQELPALLVSAFDSLLGDDLLDGYQIVALQFNALALEITLGG